MQLTNEEYRQYKPLLFSIGYRMMGSVAEAEDLVQETFLKAYEMDDLKIYNKKAYLCKIMTNRCLDSFKSARFRREQYTGPWNPEPLLKDRSLQLDPSDAYLQKEGLSIAYLRMMEHLSPDERAILLLREAFDFPYEEISELVGKKTETCRKTFSRVKLKIAGIENESLYYEQNKALIDRFIQAFQTQNMDALLELISEDAIVYSDGGGKVKAAIRPVQSRPHVLAFLFGVVKKAPAGIRFEVENANSQPALVTYINDDIHSVTSFFIENENIRELYITMNPDKLKDVKKK